MSVWYMFDHLVAKMVLDKYGICDVIPSPQWECPAPIYATTILGIDESQKVVRVHLFLPVYGFNSDCWLLMAIIVRAFKAVQVKDVQKLMFLAPKQKH